MFLASNKCCGRDPVEIKKFSELVGGLGILTREWCEFVEYRFCLNHKFGFSYIDDFLVKAFQTGWCIYSVYSLFSYHIKSTLS